MEKITHANMQRIKKELEEAIQEQVNFAEIEYEINPSEAEVVREEAKQDVLQWSEYVITNKAKKVVEYFLTKDLSIYIKYIDGKSLIQKDYGSIAFRMLYDYID